jgi:predicted amidohydrolase
LVALPEYLQYRGPDAGYRGSANPVPGPHTDPFAAVAQRHGCWVLVGSVAEAAADGRCFNTSVLLGPDGACRATYRKIHLFDVDVDSGPADRESARVAPGDRAVTAELDGLTIGLTVCYDLRFPELYRTLALRGATILTVPSSFTERTGRDHWEVLLRARAIENGAWVIAPAQVGGAPGYRSYGRSMVVDPWGTVVAQAPDVVGIVSAEIDPARAVAVRRQIPSLSNRRPSAYDLG